MESQITDQGTCQATLPLRLISTAILDGPDELVLDREIVGRSNAGKLQGLLIGMQIYITFDQDSEDHVIEVRNLVVSETLNDENRKKVFTLAVGSLSLLDNEEDFAYDILNLSRMRVIFNQELKEKMPFLEADTYSFAGQLVVNPLTIADFQQIMCQEGFGITFENY